MVHDSIDITGLAPDLKLLVGFQGFSFSVTDSSHSPYRVSQIFGVNSLFYGWITGMR